MKEKQESLALDHIHGFLGCFFVLGGGLRLSYRIFLACLVIVVAYIVILMHEKLMAEFPFS